MLHSLAERTWSEWASSFHRSFLKAVPPAGWPKRKSEIWSYGRGSTWEILCCWHGEGSSSIVQDLRVAPDWQPARKWGPQSSSHKELNLANNLNELRSRSFPTACTQPIPWSQPSLYLDSHFLRQKVAKPTRISDLQNYELINGCCSKPPFVVICFSSNRELTQNPDEFDIGLSKKHFNH